VINHSIVDHSTATYYFKMISICSASCLVFLFLPYSTRIKVTKKFYETGKLKCSKFKSYATQHYCANSEHDCLEDK